MATHYFLSENVNVPAKVGDKIFEFVPCEFFHPTNSVWGVFATDVEEDAAALDELAKSNKRIQRIDENDYELYLAKKKNGTSLKLSVDLGNPLDKLMAPVVAKPVDAPKPAPSTAEVLAPKKASKK